MFIATFASNVHRLQQVIDAAQATNRRLALLGRSMVNVVKIASELGYLTVPDGMLVEAGRLAAWLPVGLPFSVPAARESPWLLYRGYLARITGM